METKTSAIVSDNAAPETTIQYALDRGGTINITDDTYTFSGAFAGLDFPVEPLYAELYMGQATHLVVPNGYTGYVFRLMNSATQHCSKHIIHGGILDEAGAVQKLWTAIKFQSNGSTVKGIFGNIVRDMLINYCRYGIVLNNDSTGTSTFININIFDNITMYGCEVFIDFKMDTAYITDTNGFHRNRFYNITMQRTSSYTLYGVKNIAHKDNTFFGCYPVDFSGSQISSNIAADASGTIIIGGTMTSINFVDASTAADTFIQDQTKRTFFQRVTSGVLDLQPTADANNNTFSLWNTSRNTRYMIQKSTSGTIAYLIKSIKQVGGTHLPIVHSMQDVGGGTDVVSYTENIDGTLKIEKILDLETAYDQKIITIPSDPASGYTRLYPKATDANNDAPYIKAKQQGAVTELAFFP
jgi:hypothetical protein